MLSLVFVMLFSFVSLETVFAKEHQKTTEKDTVVASNNNSSNSGVDYYGYIWNDNVTYEWIDAKINGVKLNFPIGEVEIGFPFHYYDKTYNTFKPSLFGVLSFDSGQAVRPDKKKILPNETEPNNLIAPFWSLYQFDSNDTGSGVYIYRGGITPNRFAVLEWYGLTDYFYSETFNFQVILYENGDIKFQYKEVSSFYQSDFYQVIGMEDSRGLMGFSIKYPEDYDLVGKAIAITRPEPSNRVLITPMQTDLMSVSGKIEEMEFEIHNIGNLGADDFLVSIDSDWPGQLFEEDRVTPLPATVSIPEGETLKAFLHIEVPSSAISESVNVVEIKAKSLLSTAVEATSNFTLFIPSPFSLTMEKDAMREMHMVWPNARKQNILENLATYDYSEVIIRELPEIGYVVFFTGTNSMNKNVIAYQYYNKAGIPLCDQKILVEDWLPNFYTYLAAETSLDNRITVSWVRKKFSGDKYSENLWTATLDEAGNVLSQPYSVTNYGEDYCDEFTERLYISDTQIVPVGSNKLITLWRLYEGYNHTEIFYRITDSDGSVHKDMSSLTGDLPPLPRPPHGTYSLKKSARLSTGDVIVSFSRQADSPIIGDQQNCHRVLNEDGEFVKTELFSQIDVGFSGDIIQLNSGYLITTNWFGVDIIDPQNFQIINRVNGSNLKHPRGYSWEDLTSSIIIPTESGNALIIWSDLSESLFYALINTQGTVINGPFMINKARSEIWLKSRYGAVANTWSPQPGVDMVVHNYFDLYPAAPGGTASLRVQFSNLGLDAGTNSTLTLSLPEGLSYVSNDSGLEPQISGNQIIWNFGDTAFGEFKEFNIVLKAADYLPIDTTLNVGTLIETDQPDTNPADNGDSVKVWVSIPIYFPIGLR